MGTGHSSPIVVGDRVFLTTYDASTEARVVLAFAAETGEQLWSTEVLRAPEEPMHPNNTPASSTPACDGETIVVTFCEHATYVVAGVSVDGELRWRRELGPFVSRHGLHSPPVIDEGSVYLAGLQDDPASFVAKLEVATGEVIWQTITGTAVRSFSPPHLTTMAGMRCVVVSGASTTTAFNAESGEQLWRVPGPAEKTVSAICEDGDTLLVAGGRDAQLLAINCDSLDGDIRWTSSTGVPYISSPIAHDGSLHMMSDRGVYTRLDTSTGELLEKKRLCGPVSASPILAGGRLYVFDERGKAVVAEPGERLRVIAENQFDEDVYATPAPLGRSLYVRTASGLMRLEAN